MNVSKAIDRIQWRFTQCSDFSPNEKDKRSCNVIAKALEIRLEEDVLTKKAILVVYMFLQEKRGITIFDDDDKLIQEELFKYCERDWEDIVREFGSKNNLRILERTYEELGRGTNTRKEASDILRELSIDLEVENLSNHLNWMFLELKRKLSWN